MESWGFLASHARVLLRIAQDPGLRLRDDATQRNVVRARLNPDEGAVAARHRLRHEGGEV
ncbi:MAG TPA: hypothetical protein VN714_18525 [Trebonia sp.]|nr:hypothetical protein [Trebonia sp.]